MNIHSKNLLAAMRPNSTLHLGHYFGALQYWKKIQYEYDCLFMVADVHSLVQNFNETEKISDCVNNMVINWLAAGIDPSQATIFIQSKIPEQYELTALLGAITPLSWLERVPSYKEVIDELEHTDLNTYGFLGASLTQSADILMYNVRHVLAQEEQIANLELAREIARRFNHLFGREDGFEHKAQESIKKLGHKKAELYENLLLKYQQEGDDEALERARFMLHDALNLSHGDRERLFAFLENKGKVFLNEPQLMASPPVKIIGLDGQQMSYQANNTINLRDTPELVSSKVRAMTTDPARIRKTDRGNPESCPVWTLHQIYSNEEVKSWVELGCLSAGIGCLDCKGPLIDAINLQQSELIENAKPYQDEPTLVKRIITDGCLRARDIASDNLKQIKLAMNLEY